MEKWEISERKDHPEGCLRAVPQTPKVTDQTVPVMLASLVVPKGDDVSPTPTMASSHRADHGQVSPLKLVGERLREEFIFPGHKRNGFPV